MGKRNRSHTRLTTTYEIKIHFNTCITHFVAVYFCSVNCKASFISAWSDWSNWSFHEVPELYILCGANMDCNICKTGIIFNMASTWIQRLVWSVHWRACQKWHSVERLKANFPWCMNCVPYIKGLHVYPLATTKSMECPILFYPFQSISS